MASGASFELRWTDCWSQKKFSYSTKTRHPKIGQCWWNINEKVIVWWVLCVRVCVYALTHWVFPQSGSVLFLSKVMPVTMAAAPALNLSLFLFLPFLPLSFSLCSHLSFPFSRLVLVFLFSIFLSLSAASINATVSRPPAIIYAAQLVPVQAPPFLAGRYMEIIETLHTSPQCYPANPPWIWGGLPYLQSSFDFFFLLHYSSIASHFKHSCMHVWTLHSRHFCGGFCTVHAVPLYLSIKPRAFEM